MTSLSDVLSAVPAGLRQPLLDEYNSIIQNYLERKWTAAELSGGRFSEIVYWILEGHATGTYASAPTKPANMVDFCKNLEKHTHQPRGFRFLIPRMLPALYEIRNNRNVGHVGGDVDSNGMDALAVVSMCSWILGELIRTIHNVGISEAQSIVDFVTSRKIPLVWESGTTKRILNPKLPLKDQIILLVGSQATKVKTKDLRDWLDVKLPKDVRYFNDTLRKLHSTRLLNLSNSNSEAELLPPGSKHLESLVAASDKPAAKKSKKRKRSR